MCVAINMVNSVVLIFHLCSKSSMVFITRAVCRECSAADFDRCWIICVTSSAYAIYSVFCIDLHVQVAILYIEGFALSMYTHTLGLQGH